MACRLISVKPLSEPMMGVLLIGPLEANFGEILIKISSILIQENAFESVACEMAAISFRPQCVKRHCITSEMDGWLSACSRQNVANIFMARRKMNLLTYYAPDQCFLIIKISELLFSLTLFTYTTTPCKNKEYICINSGKKEQVKMVVYMF